MSGHRVELRVTFTVGDGTDGGRKAAEEVFQRLEVLGMYESATPLPVSDFTVTKGTVDGNGWHERWPDEPPEPEPCFEPGKVSLSAHRAFEFTCERVVDGVAIGYEREFDPRWNPERRRAWHGVMAEGCYTEVSPR